MSDLSVDYMHELGSVGRAWSVFSMPSVLYPFTYSSLLLVFVRFAVSFVSSSYIVIIRFDFVKYVVHLDIIQQFTNQVRMR